MMMLTLPATADSDLWETLSKFVIWRFSSNAEMAHPGPDNQHDQTDFCSTKPSPHSANATRE
jgi:hypothetical protein